MGEYDKKGGKGREVEGEEGEEGGKKKKKGHVQSNVCSHHRSNSTLSLHQSLTHTHTHTSL